MRYIVFLLLAGGCATWTPQPVDIAGHLERWRGQAGDSELLRRLGVSPDATALDRQAAARIAVYLNPTARLARLRTNATRLTADTAGPWPNPELQTEVRRAIDSGSSGWIVGASLSFTIPLSGRRAAERGIARASTVEAERAARVVEAGLTLAVDEAWIAWSTEAAHIQLLENYRRSFEPLLETAGSLAASGELSRERVFELTLEAAELQVEQQRIAGEVAIRRAELVALLGLTPNATLPPMKPDLAVAPPTRPATDWPEGHPRVRAALAGYEVSEQRLRREVARQYPDLVIGPSFEVDRGQSSIGLGLGLIPLPMFNLNKNGIAEATGGRQIARMLAEQSAEQLVSEAHAAELAAQLASERIAALERLGNELDGQLERLATLARQGELDVLLIRDCLRSLLRARVAHLHARTELARAHARLHFIFLTDSDAPAEETDR